MIRPVADTSTIYASLLGPLVFASPGPPVDLANDEVSWRFGHPAVSGTGTARGLARLFAAAVTGVDGAPPFLSADTVADHRPAAGARLRRGARSAESRARDRVPEAHSPPLAFGGPRAFGHDGAMGALACVDPDTGIAFAWTIARGPWPGGADPRALALASDLGATLAH